MKRQQEEIVSMFEPAYKYIRVSEPRAIGAGDDGQKFKIKLYLCGKCKKLAHESNLAYNETLKTFLCDKCDSKG